MNGCSYSRSWEDNTKAVEVTSNQSLAIVEVFLLDCKNSTVKITVGNLPYSLVPSPTRPCTISRGTTFGGDNIHYYTGKNSPEP